MAANMWKKNLKNVESDNNKILYETLLDFFLHRNGTYCLNKHRTYHLGGFKTLKYLMHEQVTKCVVSK